jgi:hypothetical protein
MLLCDDFPPQQIEGRLRCHLPKRLAVTRNGPVLKGRVTSDGPPKNGQMKQKKRVDGDHRIQYDELF